MAGTKKRIDPRIRRTRTLFRNALLHLLKTRQLRDIQIKEIATTAGVSRQAFYSHFKSKEDLLSNSVNEIFLQMEKEIELKNFRGDPGYDQLQAFLGYLFEQWRENISILKFAFQLRKKDLIISRLRKNIKTLVEKAAVREKRKIKNHVWQGYVLDFAAGGLYSILKRWIDDGMDIPASEMGKLSADMLGCFRDAS